jgi:hypothetical protein
LRILFDKHVPVGVRRFLLTHEVHTVVEMRWHPQLENGELLKVAEQAAFDVMVTSDQNIQYQQNLTGRTLALVVLGSNIWPVVRLWGGYGAGADVFMAHCETQAPFLRAFADRLATYHLSVYKALNGLAIKQARWNTVAPPRD